MRLFIPSTLFALLFTYIISPSLNAQTTISGDRPGYAVSSSTLEKGTGQLETGFQYRRYKYLTAISWPPMYYTEISARQFENYTTFRLGITNWLEVKTDLNLYQGWYTNLSIEKDFAFAPPALGTRIRLFQCDKGARGFFYGTTSLPFLSTISTQPISDFRFLYSVPLNSNWTIDLNAGALIAWSNQDLNLNSDVAAQYAVVLSWSLSDKVGLFGEYFGMFNPGQSQGSVDGGLIFLPSERVQLDISGGISIHSEDKEFSRDFTDMFITAGFAWRFPD